MSQDHFVCALVAHGNEMLEDPEATFPLEWEGFGAAKRFYNSVQPDRRMETAQEWLVSLRKRGARRIALLRQDPGQPFEGAFLSSASRLLVYFSDYCEIVSFRYENEEGRTAQDALDEFIAVLDDDTKGPDRALNFSPQPYHVALQIFTSVRAICRRWLAPNLMGRIDTLRKCLEEVIAFAKAAKEKSWAEFFQKALSLLDSPFPSSLHYPPFFPAHGYGLEALQLFYASLATLPAFGGMGTWNDLGFDKKERTQIYREVSQRLYQAANLGETDAINGYGLEINSTTKDGPVDRYLDTLRGLYQLFDFYNVGGWRDRVAISIQEWEWNRSSDHHLACYHKEGIDDVLNVKNGDQWTQAWASELHIWLCAISSALAQYGGKPVLPIVLARHAERYSSDGPWGISGKRCFSCGYGKVTMRDLNRFLTKTWIRENILVAYEQGAIAKFVDQILHHDPRSFIPIKEELQRKITASGLALDEQCLGDKCPRCGEPDIATYRWDFNPQSGTVKAAANNLPLTWRSRRK